MTDGDEKYKLGELTADMAADYEVTWQLYDFSYPIRQRTKDVHYHAKHWYHVLSRTPPHDQRSSYIRHDMGNNDAEPNG